eukprot:498282_1
MASFSLFFWSTILFFYAHLVSVESQVSVHVYCDNFGQILHSHGAGFIVDADRPDGSWGTMLSATITGVSSSTIIKVMCQDGGHTGGFMGQVTYSGQQYYTKNPISSSLWTVTAASAGGTAITMYKLKDTSPWSGTSTLINSNAYWIWNSNGGNSMTFELKMSDILSTPTPQPTPKPTPKPTTPEPTPKPTPKPTTRDPTTAEPTTAEPTTADPTTADPTTAEPTTSRPTTAEPTTAEPTAPTPRPTYNEAQVKDATTADSPENTPDKDPLVNDPHEAGSSGEIELEMIVAMMLGVVLCLTCLCAFLAWKFLQQKKAKQAEMNLGSAEMQSNATNPESGPSYVGEGGVSNEVNAAAGATNVLGATHAIDVGGMNRDVLKVQELPLPQELPPPPGFQGTVGGLAMDKEDRDDSDDLYDNDDDDDDAAAYGQDGGVTQGDNGVGDGNCVQNNGFVEDEQRCCSDCGLKKPGKVFDTDGSFYCMDCWTYYEQQ